MTSDSPVVGVTPAAVYLWEKGERQPEGPALRVIYTLHEKLEKKKLKQGELEDVFKAIAIGAAAFGFIALLGALFSGEKK